LLFFAYRFVVVLLSFCAFFCIGVFCHQLHLGLRDCLAHPLLVLLSLHPYYQSLHASLLSVPSPLPPVPVSAQIWSYPSSILAQVTQLLLQPTLIIHVQPPPLSVLASGP
jgi:hypothetical protein